MVVDYPSMSSVDFEVPDFCFLVHGLINTGNKIPKSPCTMLAAIAISDCI
jgi:hypothetical protein